MGARAMNRQMGAALAVLCAAALVSCASTGRETAVQAAEEERYTFHFSGAGGVLTGTVTVRRDGAGKVTVTPALSGVGDYDITAALCPLIPEWLGGVNVDEELKEVIIEGNTVKASYSEGFWHKTAADGNTVSTIRSVGYWEKSVVDGDTSTTAYPNGYWEKTAADGNTITTIRSDGYWEKTVADGNTSTTTYPTGYWEKTVVDGNTTTTTYPNGDWEKTVVDGDTAVSTNSYGAKEVVEKRGCDIFIRRESGGAMRNER
jgi:hypothetical protein